VEVLLNDLHASKKLELILDLNKIITCTCVDTAWDHDSNRDEVIHDLLDDIPDTILLVVAVD